MIIRIIFLVVVGIDIKVTLVNESTVEVDIGRMFFHIQNITKLRL